MLVMTGLIVVDVMVKVTVLEVSGVPLMNCSTETEAVPAVVRSEDGTVAKS
jgi:hypothetical protein